MNSEIFSCSPAEFAYKKGFEEVIFPYKVFDICERVKKRILSFDYIFLQVIARRVRVVLKG